MTQDTREPRLLRKKKISASSIKDFCRRYGIAETTFHNWQHKGIGPKTIKIGGTVRITDEDEREWLEKARNGGFPTPQKEEAPSKERRKKKRIRRREDDQ